MRAVISNYVVETRLEDELIFRPYERIRGTIVIALRRAALVQMMHAECINVPECEVRLRGEIGPNVQAHAWHSFL